MVSPGERSTQTKNNFVHTARILYVNPMDFARDLPYFGSAVGLHCDKSAFYQVLCAFLVHSTFYFPQLQYSALSKEASQF